MSPRDGFRVRDGSSGETMDGGLVGQLARGQNQRRGGTSSLRRDRVVVQDRTEDSGKEMSPLPKHGRNIWVMENRSRMVTEGLGQDTGKHEM